MPTSITSEKVYRIEGFSGMQATTSRFVRQPTDLEYAQNVSYDEIGSVSKKLGIAQRGDRLTSTTTTSTSTSTTTTSTSTTSTSSSTTTTA